MINKPRGGAAVVLFFSVSTELVSPWSRVEDRTARIAAALDAIRKAVAP